MTDNALSADEEPALMSPTPDASQQDQVPSPVAAYAPRTAWGPWLALIATALIVVVAMAVSGLVQLVPSTGTLTALAAFQISVILLTLAAAAFGGRDMDPLAMKPAPSLATCAWAVGILVVFGLVVTTLEFRFLRDQLFQDLRLFVEIARGHWWIPGLLVVGIAAPLSEELLFRGFLFSALARSRIGILGATLVSTTLWTAMHAGYTVVGLIEVFTIGIILSGLLWKTGSLRVAILCHAVYNSLIMLGLRYLPLPPELLPA
jgi:uncharacterized protein